MRKIVLREKKGVLILLLFMSVQLLSFAQTIDLTGTVTDNKGVPLPGVNITVVGTTIGTSTDINGTYALVVPADPPPSISYSFVGF
jgi:hypothetical protein